jgi:uncharacterized iron-regulated membrane protein
MIKRDTTDILDKSLGRSGILRQLHMIHGSLMIPGVGRQVVGWLGVAMLISSLTGLWLWWPTVGQWTRGLRWRRSAISTPTRIIWSASGLPCR